jgi:small subunit ribosomal protein S2
MIPGNDDAMRAAELYAIAIADAILEGKASIPALPVGEDDFVELDSEGKPKSAPDGRRAAPAKRATRKAAATRRDFATKPAAPEVKAEDAASADADIVSGDTGSADADVTSDDTGS